MAVQQQNRVVKLGSATDILRLFGRSQSGTHYRKLMESFDRIFSATIYWGTQGQLENRRFIEQYRVSMLDHVRLWYCDMSQRPGAAFDNVVTLRGRLKRSDRLQSSQHEPNHRNVNECLGRFRQTLVVCLEPSPSAQPCKGSLDNPAPR